MNKITQIINEEYGFGNSLEAAFDKNNKPLPLYTYSAIEYLNSLDFSNKTIFEFGSGQSTLYWIEKGANVTSVENSAEWFNKINILSGNKAIYAKHQNEYVNSILEHDSFDLIIIDGIFSRYLCSQNAIKKIKSNGLIILDHSDWYPNTAKLIKESLDWIQVDFYGIRPTKTDTSVTSFFFSRNSNLKSKSGRQPTNALGGKNKHSKLDCENPTF
ncbi:MAG: hypothetical protein ACJAW3_001157 [Lentimonas sp.]|jgi:hypothetical protein